MKTKKVNGDEPATQHDLAVWGGRLTERIDELGSEMRQLKDDIIREFKVTAENIHQDVAGANQDEISSIKDSVGKIDERVKVVEERLGISTPPAKP